MKILLPRASLLQTIHRVIGIADRKNTIPILGNILLRARTNSLQLTATDMEVGIRSETSADVLQTGATTVSAHKFFDIIKELDPEADVTLEMDEHFLIVRSGKSRFRLAVLPAEDYPDLSFEEDAVAIRLPAVQLSGMITATSFAMSTDRTRKYLTGTLFEVDGTTLSLVATDGHRLSLSQARIAGETISKQCIVPRKAVMEMRKLCDEYDQEVVIHLGERQIRLELGSDILVSKLIDARFPDYRSVIPNDNPLRAFLDRIAFDQALRRCMIVADEFSHDVRLSFSSDGLVISANNPDQEEAEEHMALEYEGAEMEIGFNGRYLRDILGVISSEKVCMEFRDQLSPALIHAEDHADAKYVVMPMKI